MGIRTMFSRPRRLVLLIMIGINVVSVCCLLALHFRPQWFFPPVVEDEECRNAPAVVPYHPGMTLCPGQSARIEMEIPVSPPQDPPPPRGREKGI